MEKAKKLLNNKGNAELLAFLLILPLLLTVAFNPIMQYVEMNKYSGLEDIAKKYILVMETEGGLTDTQYANLQNELIEKNYVSDVTIDYTPYPAEFGTDVALKITMSMKTTRINLLGGMASETIPIVAGPYTSISKRVVSE